jgi:hypothetical protein
VRACQPCLFQFGKIVTVFNLQKILCCRFLARFVGTEHPTVTTPKVPKGKRTTDAWTSDAVCTYSALGSGFFQLLGWLVGWFGSLVMLKLNGHRLPFPKAKDRVRSVVAKVEPDQVLSGRILESPGECSIYLHGAVQCENQVLTLV